MIQAYYKYKPASYRALALLVYADGKDRMTQEYHADMLRAIAMRPSFAPPSLREILISKPKKALTREQAKKKADSYVDKLLRTFGRGGVNNETRNP